MSWREPRLKCFSPTPEAIAEYKLLLFDIWSNARCRKCDDPPPGRGWDWMRLESAASAVFTPDDPPVLGTKFECGICGAIHLGVPLPEREGMGRIWSHEDDAVKLALSYLPPMEGVGQRRVPQELVRGARGAAGVGGTVPPLASETPGPERRTVAPIVVVSGVGPRTPTVADRQHGRRSTIRSEGGATPSAVRRRASERASTIGAES